MQLLWPWFVVAQAALLPLLAPGSEVRLVSPDLLEVLAFGTVEDGRLSLQGSPLLPGTEVRLLVLPPNAGAADRAAAAVAADAAGAPAPTGRAVEGDVLIVTSDGEARSLRALLAEQGIEVRLPGEAPR
jgi:hypothetical protein